MENELNDLLKTFVKYDDQLRANTLDNNTNILHDKEMPRNNNNISNIKRIKKRKRGSEETTSFEYDFSFNINFEKLFKEEIDVQVSKDFKETYNENLQCPLIGILGKSNTGKTFLLSKCFDLCDSYKKGITEHTPNIALKYAKNKQILLIDSMGTGTALEKEHINNETEQKLNLLSEQFRTKFILDCCGTIIYTMGNFDESEKQQYELIKQSKPKMLIVVHNLPDVETIKDIEIYIQKSIKNIFDVQEYSIVSFRENKTKYYLEKENLNYIHCIFGKWESEELEDMNNEVITYISDKLLSDVNFKGLNIINHISAFLEKFLIYNFTLDYNNNNNSNEDNQSLIIKREQIEKFKLDIDIENEKMKIQYEDGYVFLLSKIGSLDGTFLCNSYRVYQIESDKKIIIEIDLLGPIDIKTAKIKGKKIDAQYYTVLFEAKYNTPIIEGAKYIDNKNTRQLFRADIKFAVSENIHIINLVEPITSHDKGVFKLEYEYEDDNEVENELYEY